MVFSIVLLQHITATFSMQIHAEFCRELSLIALLHFLITADDAKC